MTDVFNVLVKNHYSPQTLHVIPIWSLSTFSIQFWYKVYFKKKK